MSPTTWRRWAIDPPAASRSAGTASHATCAVPLEGVITVHHGHMQEIDVVDAEHATSITAMYDRLEFADGHVQHGFGHYEETYTLDEGAWRIARMTLRRLRMWRYRDALPTDRQRS